MKLIEKNSDLILDKYYLCYEVFTDDDEKAIVLGKLEDKDKADTYEGDNSNYCFRNAIFNVTHSENFDDETIWYIYQDDPKRKYNPQCVFELDDDEILTHFVAETI